MMKWSTLRQTAIHNTTISLLSPCHKIQSYIVNSVKGFMTKSMTDYMVTLSYYPLTNYWQSSSQCEAFSQSLLPLWSFAKTFCSPPAAVPQSLWHPCRGRAGGSRSWRVDHRHASTPMMATPIPRLGADSEDLICTEQYVEVGQRDRRDPVFVCVQ